MWFVALSFKLSKFFHLLRTVFSFAASATLRGWSCAPLFSLSPETFIRFILSFSLVKTLLLLEKLSYTFLAAR